MLCIEIGDYARYEGAGCLQGRLSFAESAAGKLSLRSVDVGPATTPPLDASHATRKVIAWEDLVNAEELVLPPRPCWSVERACSAAYGPLLGTSSQRRLFEDRSS